MSFKQTRGYFCVVLLFLVACSAKEQTGGHVENNGTAAGDHLAMKRIDGTVIYRERMRLKPGAVIEIELLDVAKQDTAAPLIANARLPAENGPPFAFSLKYDPAKIQQTGRYGLRAHIEADGQTIFASMDFTPAFNTKSPVEILVKRVSSTRNSNATGKPDASLVNTYWKITGIDGQPAALGAGKKELNMVLSTGPNGVHGYSGCNSFTGAYEHKDDKLTFSQVASTSRACVDGMRQEGQFLQALSKVVRFTIDGDNFALYSSDERLILRGEAVYLN